MEQAFEVHQKDFFGPFDKLLALIEEKKLEITRLNLAEITADFLAYLQTLKNANSDILADFLVVASKLILIKSKILVPELASEEDEEEIKNLEERLKFHQQFREAKETIKNLWSPYFLMSSREYLCSLKYSFYPPKNFSFSLMEEKISLILKQVSEFFQESREIKIKVIKLEEKIQEFLKRLEEIPLLSFNKVINNRPKQEIVVYFLAILHLIREGIIDGEQKEYFSEIVIKKI